MELRSTALGGNRFDLMTYDSELGPKGQGTRRRGGEKKRERRMSRRAMTPWSDAPFGCSLKHTSSLGFCPRSRPYFGP